MPFELSLPRIEETASPEERIASLYRYIFALTEQLRYALDVLETPASGTSMPAVPQHTAGSTAASAETPEHFQEIKALLLKSADVVSAYYDQMQTKLRSDFVAQSAFGTYRSAVQSSLTATAEALTQLTEEVQSTESSVEGIGNAQRAVSAHIRTGLLTTDAQGNGVYGVEVGQKNTVDGEEVFHKYARFTADRLSFYDRNDTEVAYISDYKLYITNAEITNGLTLGGYVLDTSDGVAWKWQ